MLEIQLLSSLYDTYYMRHSNYHEGDSGLDLFIIEDKTIPAHQTYTIGLGIKCQSVSFQWNIFKWFTSGFKKYNSFMIFPRSSISKTPLRLANSIGLIDAGYLGELKIALHNTSDMPYHITRGQRLVQLVNKDLSPIQYKIVNNLDRLTSRMDGGFGSTN